LLLWWMEFSEGVYVEEFLCSILVKCCAVRLILFLCWCIGYCYLIGILCN
jgi:hypothetical protein